MFVYSLFFVCILVFQCHGQETRRIYDRQGKKYTWIDTAEVQVSVLPTRNSLTPYAVHLKAFEQEWNLTLRRPDESVFADGFYEEGSSKAKALQELENSIFIDEESHAVVQILQKNDTFTLKGHVNNFGVFYRNGVYQAIRGALPDPTPDVQPQMGCDFSKPPKVPAQSGTQMSGTIEAMILYDKAMDSYIAGQGLNEDTYFGIMYNSINMIYKSISNPRLKFKLVGIERLPAEQENDIVTSSNRDLTKMLDELQKFVADTNHNNLSANDVTSFFTGIDSLEIGGAGGYAGLGTPSAACGQYTPTKRQVGCAVISDVGAFFLGVESGAHETGHNLGCDHDFCFTTRPDCVNMMNDPDSFVMGYNGSTANRYRFSDCSKAQIAYYTLPPSTLGKCIFKKNFKGAGKDISNKLPGEALSLDQLCRGFAAFATDITPVTTTETATDDCNIFECPIQGDGETLYKRFSPPDGTPCKFNFNYGYCNDATCQKDYPELQGKTISEQCAAFVNKNVANAEPAPATAAVNCANPYTCPITINGADYTVQMPSVPPGTICRNGFCSNDDPSRCVKKYPTPKNISDQCIDYVTQNYPSYQTLSTHTLVQDCKNTYPCPLSKGDTLSKTPYQPLPGTPCIISTNLGTCKSGKCVRNQGGGNQVTS